MTQFNNAAVSKAKAHIPSGQQLKTAFYFEQIWIALIYLSVRDKNFSSCYWWRQSSSCQSLLLLRWVIKKNIKYERSSTFNVFLSIVWGFIPSLFQTSIHLRDPCSEPSMPAPRSNISQIGVHVFTRKRTDYGQGRGKAALLSINWLINMRTV